MTPPSHCSPHQAAYYPALGRLPEAPGDRHLVAHAVDAAAVARVAACRITAAVTRDSWRIVGRQQPRSLAPVTAPGFTRDDVGRVLKRRIASVDPRREGRRGTPTAARRHRAHATGDGDPCAEA